MQKMYEGKVNSPESYLKEKLVAESTIIYIADDSILPNLPNLLVIGEGDKAETVLVKNKRSDGGYDVQRAFEGVAKIWGKSTVVARNFTNYDYKTLVNNINELDKNKANASDIKTQLSQLIEDSSHRTVTDSEKTTWNKVIDKVDKVDGKGLSTNDYTNEDKQEVAKIKNKIDSDGLGSVQITRASGASKWSDSEKRQLGYFLQDFHERTKELKESKADKTELDKKVNKSDIKTKLSQLTDDSSHRLVTDNEKAKWNKVTDKADKTEIEQIKKANSVVYHQIDTANFLLKINDYVMFFHNSGSRIPTQLPVGFRPNFIHTVISSLDDKEVTIEFSFTGDISRRPYAYSDTFCTIYSVK